MHIAGRLLGGAQVPPIAWMGWLALSARTVLHRKWLQSRCYVGGSCSCYQPLGLLFPCFTQHNVPGSGRRRRRWMGAGEKVQKVSLPESSSAPTEQLPSARGWPRPGVSIISADPLGGFNVLPAIFFFSTIHVLLFDNKVYLGTCEHEHVPLEILIQHLGFPSGT